MKKYNKKQKGFVTLMSILIVGAVSTSIAVFLILAGMDAYRATANLEESAQAKAIADACAEKALNSIKDDTQYSGNETISFERGSCSVLPVVGSVNQISAVEVSGTVSSTVRKVKVITSQVTPQIEIQSWQEVADF